MRLYDYELSADCYKVRLLAAILGIPLERVPVDFYPGFKHQGAAFRAISPDGVLPVLDDDGVLLVGARAILVALVRRYDPGGTWGDERESAGVTRWLDLADGLARTAGRARLHDNIAIATDIGACRAGARDLLRQLDDVLWLGEQSGHWFLDMRDAPSIADLACFPDFMLSEEGGIAHLPYPAIRRWADRVKRIPGFILMPGIFGADPPSVSR